MTKKEITIGAFCGLITKAGKVRLQMRTEKGSILGPNVSYKGDFELPGGRVQEEDLQKALSAQVLAREAVRETKEELGIVVTRVPACFIYRAVYVFPDKPKEDWAFTIPIPSDCWNDAAKVKREIVDVSPTVLNTLAKSNLVVSGIGKRMWRMAQAAIYATSSNYDWQKQACNHLNHYKSDWKDTEYFEDTGAFLARLRQEVK